MGQSAEEHHGRGQRPATRRLQFTTLAGVSLLALSLASGGAKAADSLLVGAGGVGGTPGGTATLGAAGGGGGIGGGGGGTSNAAAGGGAGVGGGSGGTVFFSGGAGGSGATGGAGGVGTDANGGAGGLGGGGGAFRFGGGGGALGGAGGSSLNGGAGGIAGANVDGSGNDGGGGAVAGSGSLYGGGGGSNISGNSGGGGGGGGGRVVDGDGNDVSGKTASAGANAPNSLTISNTRAYDYVGVGGGGGGGGSDSGNGDSTPGGAGSAGTLTLTNANLTTNYSMLVGGAGGGAGFKNGGNGGSGTVLVQSGTTLTVGQTLLIGGSGGGGGLDPFNTGADNGGNGGAGSVTVDATSAIAIGAGGALVLGGANGGNFGSGGTEGIGGTGGTGTLSSAGTLTFGTGAGFTINSGSTFNLGTAVAGASTTGTITGLSSVANNGTINFNQSNSTYTFAASITGSGSLNQNGSGTTTLAGSAGTFTGIVNVTAGTLALGAGGVMSSADTSIGVASGSTGALSVSGAGASWTIVSGGQLVIGDSGTGSLTVGSGGLLTSQTVFLGYAASGAGTLTLAGNDSDGRGMVATTQVRKRLGAGQIVFNGGGLRATAPQTDFLSGFLSSDIDIQSGGAIIDTNGHAVTISQDLSGTGGLTKQGTGTLTLSAATTYFGATVISAGTLALSGNGSIASSASLLVDGTFDISGITGPGAFVNNLSGDATTGVVALGAKTLTVTQQTEFLQLAGGLSGTGTLVKQGTEALTLSGDSSAFSGTVQVNAGTLSITDWGGLTAATVGGNVSVASGGTLEAAGATIDGTVTIASGGILEWTRNGSNIGNIAMGALSMDAGAVTRINLNSPSGASSIISVTGDAAVNGTLNLVSTPAYGAGVYRVITTGGTLTDNGMVLGETQPDYTFRIDTQPQSLDVVVTALDTTVQYWSADGTTRGGGGNWTSGNNWLGAGGGYAVWAGDTAVFDGTFGIVMVDGTQSFNTIEFLTSGYTLQAGVSGQLNLGAGGRLWAEGDDIIVTVAAPIIGTGALTKIGEGTIVLSGINTYQGGTIIQAGTLEISSDANLGDAAGSITFAGGELEATTTLTSARNVVLNAQATISVEEASTLTLTGTLSGTAGLAFGGGTLVLSGINTYQGATIIGSGTLSLTGTGSIAASSGVEANGVFDISGTTSGASIVSLSGTGAVALGAQTLTITSGSGAFTGTIGGTGGLTVSGGTQALSGVNGFTGETRVEGGTLALTGTGSVASSSGVVANGTFDISGVSGGGTSVQTLSGTGSVVLGANVLTLTAAAGDFQGGISGIGGLMVAGGTQTLSGTNTYSGTTTVAAGATLVAASSGAMSGGPVALEGTLQLDTPSATIGGLSGAGAVLAPGGTISLTIAPASGTTSVFSGTLTSAPSATLGLVVNGPGTQVLASDLTYGGGTTILQGTLQLGNGGASGSIQGDVVNNGTLAFNRSGTVTFADDISGTGALTQMGPGTLILTGENSYTGNTTIAAGTLQVGDGGTQGSLQGNVVNNGALVFNRSGTVTFAGDISGTGALTQMGTGTLILTGENSYAGSTTIAAGTLQVGDGGAQGSLQGNVVNNGALVFNRSGTVNFAGDISGTGTLTQMGPGTLVLAGTSSYSGGTSIRTGTLVLGTSTAAGTGAIAMSDGTTLGLAEGVSVTNDLILGGAVTFELASGSATLSGALSGTGAIAFSGGRISLTGDSSAFTGATVVNGTLAVNGLLGGSVTVANGGTLKGSGTVGSTTVAAGGTVAPGNSIGTLTVNGTLAFASGSTYAVEIDNTGASDLILVTGTATLGGATVAVTKAAGAYLPGTHYTILTAQGGITGTFSGSTQDMPFVDLALSYDAQNAFLDVARNATPFPSVAVTANQRATAGAVEALGQGNAVYDAVVSQTSVAGAQQAFNALDGEIYPSALSAFQQESLILRRAVLDRARVPSGSASTPLAYASGSAAGADVVGMAGSPSAFWAQAFGDWSRIGGNGNAATVSGDTAGVIVGYDRTFVGAGADWHLGFAAGYSSSDYQVNARSSSLSSDNAHVALYGGTRMGALGVRLGAAYSWADISANRTVAFPGVLNALDTDTFARTGQVFGEVGYGLSFAKVQVEPFAGLAYVNVDMNGFTELGGPSALTAAGSSAGVTYSTLGARLSAPFDLGGLPAAFNGTLAWQHAFGDTSPDTLFAFGAGALPFSVSGVPIASDAALVEAGLDLNVAPNAALSVFYAGQISQDDTSNMVKGRFTLKF